MEASELLSLLPEGEMRSGLTIRDWGQQLYRPVYDAMRAFTTLRRSNPELNLGDEIWVVEHEPVYTMGQATPLKHLPKAGTPAHLIEIAAIDRGGQITYHGPGQLVLYFLLDLTARKWSVKKLVSFMEDLVIDDLSSRGISAATRPKAPGVYVDGKKIAALGIKIKHGCSYHGLSVNIDMDLTPFDWINPCGYIGMPVTQYREWIAAKDLPMVKHSLIECAVTLLTA